MNRQWYFGKIPVVAVRFLLGIVFVIASVDKISSPDAFAASIHAYKLTPELFDNLLALIIPWLELVCGIALLVGSNVRASAAILAALLGIFTIAIASALLRGLTIDCGCFGKEHLTPVSWMKVLEDIGLLLAAAYVYFGSQRD